LIPCCKTVDTFHLDDHLPIDDEIEAMDIDLNTLIQNGISLLVLERNVRRSQLEASGARVRRLYQPWPKFSVHLDAAANYSKC